MSKKQEKELKCEIEVSADAKTSAPEDATGNCLYCYVNDEKCSPGTIINFAGVRRECVVINGVADWRDFYAANAQAEPVSSAEEFDCPDCYVLGQRNSRGTIMNFAGQRRECVIVNGQGEWQDL